MLQQPHFMLSVCVCVRVFATCTMRSYTQPKDLTKATLEKVVACPKSYWRKSAGKRNKQSNITSMPTNPTFESRPANTSFQRRALKQCTHPDQLLETLKTAIVKRRVDVSVIGAAMQHCGIRRWWDVLMEVRQIQKSERIRSTAVLRNIFTTAITRAAHGNRFGIVLNRRERLIPLAQEIWAKAKPAVDSDTFNAGLGAALNLCAVAKEPAALKWAEQLWMQANKTKFQMDEKKYSDYIRVLETHQQHDQVDALLPKFQKCITPPLLGAVLDDAAMTHNWQRGEMLWNIIVNEFGVQPTNIQFTTRAKLHLLSGRPSFAARTLDEMVSRNLEHRPRSCTIHLQAIVIVTHSSLSGDSYRELRSFLKMGKSVMATAVASTTEQQEWDNLNKLAKTLLQDAKALRLHDVLLCWQAKTSSRMKTWPNHDAGTNYLQEDVF